MMLDTSTSKICIQDNLSEMTLNEATMSDSISMKNLLKEKWKEVNSEP